MRGIPIRLLDALLASEPGAQRWRWWKRIDWSLVLMRLGQFMCLVGIAGLVYLQYRLNAF